MRTGRPVIPIENRFLSKVMPEPNTGCWLWMGGSKGKYGSIGRGGRGGKSLLAHRLSFELFKGDPSGLMVCHSCDTPCCVNPDHLFLGTNQDNQNDMRLKGRDNYLFGSSHSQAKLNDTSILEIRSMKGKPVKLIAKKYNISVSTVSDITNNRTWKHI